MFAISQWLKSKFEHELMESLEIPRGLLHITFLTSYSYLLLSKIPSYTLAIFLSFLLLILFTLEFSKSKNAVGKLFVKIGKPFMREDEMRNRYTSAIGTLLGLIISTLAYSKEVAMLSVLFLAIGDPVSRGTRKLLLSLGIQKPYSEISGFLSMTVTCFLICIIFSSITPLKALFAGMSASFVETFLEIKLTKKLTLDDNFFIPIISGLILTTLLAR